MRTVILSLTWKQAVLLYKVLCSLDVDFKSDDFFLLQVILTKLREDMELH